MPRLLAPLILLGLLSCAPARAHPHVFVDVDVAFLMKDGRLGALRLGWAFDPLYSMLVLEELGIDAGAPLDANARATVAALQPDWAAEFGGEGALSVDGADAALGPARVVAVGMEDGRLVMRFERPLAAPVDPHAAAVVAAVYDPAYFVAYLMTGAARVEGAADCAATVLPFEPGLGLGDLQTTLLGLSMEQIPADPQVGRLFADRVRLSCG